MGHRLWRLGALLVGLAAEDAAAAQEIPPEISAIIAAGTQDPHGVATYVVHSLEQQHDVLRALGVEPLSQALVFDDDGTPYDVVETSKGTVRFDVSALIKEGD